MKKLFFKIRFAFWIWPSVIGMFVCLCLFYGIFYLLGAFFPEVLGLSKTMISHNVAILDATILLVAGIIGIWKPISGGLAVVYIVALIVSVVSVFNHNYIAIIIWLLFIAFSTWSIMRKNPPYYNRLDTHALEEGFRKLEQRQKNEELS